MKSVVLPGSQDRKVRYINFEVKGMVLRYGCGTPGMTVKSQYPDKA